MNNNPSVIFDLDGTLIDSAPGILNALETVIRINGIMALQALDYSIIGPPLKETLYNLTGITDAVLIDKLVADFKEDYDSSGYNKTKVFPGVSKMLNELKKREIDMYIATNKRLLPTTKILEFLRWGRYFKAIYAVDSKSKPFETKGLMLKDIIFENNLNTSSLIYVGDRAEDGIAADFCRINFIKAAWGYDADSNKIISSQSYTVKSPGELTEIVLNTNNHI